MSDYPEIVSVRNTKNYSPDELITLLRNADTEVSWTGKNGIMEQAANLIESLLTCRRPYTTPSGKVFHGHHEAVDAAIDAFLRFEGGAIYYEGQPRSNFGVMTGAMAAAIQAYLDERRKGVGETNG